MDKHYSELDKELTRLKSELDIQDEMTSRFTAPVSTNYWQKRLEEEKELWRKRMLGREEEKKVLESRLRRQESELKEYQSKLSDVEKTFERELKNWEEKFRVKEADLLLEKNRILWEEKVKDAESETRQILEKIGTLNETIARMKDEAASEKEKMLARFDEEKKMLADRISFLESALENLKSHYLDVKNLALSEDEKLRKEIASRAAEIEGLSAELSAVAAERNALKKETDSLRSDFAEESMDIDRKRRAATAAASERISSRFAALVATLEYRRRMKMPPADESAIFTAETAAILDSLKSGEPETSAPAVKPTVAVMGTSEQLKEMASALSDKCSPVFVSTAADMEKVAPAAMVSDDVSAALKAAKLYPFLPVAVIAASPLNISNPPDNLRVFASENPASVVSAVRETELAAESSIAHPEIWSTLVPPHPPIKRGAFIAAAAALAVAAGLYFLAPMSPAIKEFAVPYPMPTAVALDGKYLWSCDWQGGAIYQHEIDDKLTLRRVAYFPGRNFSAVTYHDGALYTADPWGKKINRHLINDTFTVDKEYAASDIAAGAMTFAAGRLYIADARTNTVLECRLDDESRKLIALREISIGATTLAGLWFDGKNLWSADAARNFVRRHRMDGALAVEAVYMMPSSAGKNFRISGFAGKGKDFWISSERAGKIISVPLTKLVKVEGVSSGK